jgi:hypothetical protein
MRNFRELVYLTIPYTKYRYGKCINQTNMVVSPLRRKSWEKAQL